MFLRAAFFLLALAAVQVTADVPVSYLENLHYNERTHGRIVSGWDARPGQHPHQVSLRMVNPAGLVSGCGGSVISREWVVTSAHCTATQITIVVRAGVVAMTRPEVMVESSEYYIYPTFDATTPGTVQPDDISLLKLPLPLAYNSNLRPIRVQSRLDAFRNYQEQVVYASGFGRTWTNGPQPEVLQWVYLRGVSNPSCVSVFSSRFVTDNTICARFFNVTSQSICQGDSGGPLVHVNEEGVPILIGVSSFVAALPFGCHSGLPGAFIRPGPFHSWFTDVTGIDFETLNEEETTTTSVPTTETSPTNATTAPTTITSPSTNATTTTTTITSPSTNATTPPTTITSPSTNATTTTTIITSPSTNATTPSTTITSPSTNATEPTTITTTTPSNVTTTTTTPTPEEDDDSENEDDDPELADLLKRLEVFVKVKVRMSKLKNNGKE